MTETSPETPPEPVTVVLDDQQLVQLAASVASELATHLGMPTTGPVAPGQPVEVSVELPADGPPPVPVPLPDTPVEPGAPGGPLSSSPTPVEPVQEASV